MFLKISCLTFESLNSVKKYVSESILKDSKNSHIYETSLPGIVRFMVDSNLTGVNYVQVPATYYSTVNQNFRVTNCQFEFVCNYKNLTSHNPIGSWSSIAPIRILSFDIECAGRKGIFPDPLHDPVITIGCSLKILGNSSFLYKSLFCLRQTSLVVDANVQCFDSESSLLLSWSQFIRNTDPDVIIGYNISNFDFPYLLERAKHLGLKDFPYLGRLKNRPSISKNSFFSSKAYGTRESKITSINSLIFRY